MSDSILGNELVRKYFSCEAMEIRCPNGNEQLEHMALRILEAMQEKINPGDKYLEVNLGNIEFKTWNKSVSLCEYFCPQTMRLPSRFQPQMEQEWGVIPCPDKKPGCLVIHYGHLKPQTEGDAKLLMETHISRFHTPLSGTGVSRPPPDAVESLRLVGS